MTARTSAHLAPLCDDLMSEMQKIKGTELSKLFYESQAAAVDRMEDIQKTEGIDCDFRRLDGFLFQAIICRPTSSTGSLMPYARLGAPVERLMGVPFAGCENRHGLRYPEQATFHPLKYLAGVAEACAKREVRFFAEPCRRSSGGEWRGHRQDRAGQHSRGPHHCRHQLTYCRPCRAAFQNVALSDVRHRFWHRPGRPSRCALWDTEEPYHYVRMQPGDNGKDFVLVDGEDHKSGRVDDADERFGRLEEWARGKMPMLKDVTHRWSGQVLDTIDYAGFIGKNPVRSTPMPRLAIPAKAAHGVMGAILNATLVTGGQSDWTDLYASDRKPLKAAKNWVVENSTALKNLSAYLAPGEMSSADELKPGQGAILRQGLHKIAAYRDAKGTVHQHSAACTHLGCHLHWNSFESCWDCPCRSSIFGPDRAECPAISALFKIS
jgi:Rieske Fe-S protein